jgi:hypothetical protein
VNGRAVLSKRARHAAFLAVAVMLGGISAPRPPSLRQRQQFIRRSAPSQIIVHRPQQPNIRSRKRIRFVQRPQRNVLRCPFPDSGQRAKPRHRTFQIARRTEKIVFLQRRSRHGT